ncbi:hypothetical protein, unknown function [Leishmania tarentolae]|uniref:Uncharacterized protein n=1 Tax=Leishmania tarentolae TaxID=5689 RepID=A0A640KAU1_LEITA|nr:hypothetical protein, unknown function [Leishmania tarentolae]
MLLPPRLGLVALLIFVAAGYCACTVTEGKLRPPYTQPVIQTSHKDAVHPESGAKVSVLPVSFNPTVAEPFLTPATLMDGERSTGKAITPQHIFTNAALRLVFDVPNPGLDFVINLTSAKYPLIRDPNGTLWHSVLPSKIEVVKQNSKYTYDVGNINVKSYQSQSESVELVAGAPGADAECFTLKACCAVNTSHYRKYELRDSPVPPYVCTGVPIPYSLRQFTFNVDSTVQFREVAESASCEMKTHRWTEGSAVCTANSNTVLAGVTASPPYRLPSSGYSLCRQGGNLTNSEFGSSPIPVVFTAFCSESRCIGYTPENYRRDRGSCADYPLGFYTSADENNTNQFSSFEENAAGLWPYFFKDCKWIDDVTMSSSTTIQDISLQCDVPASTGWSLSYENFSAHLTDTIAPLFPIGRPTRVSGQYVSPTDKDTVLFEVEYVSFSSFKASRWTFRICTERRCAIPTVPMVGGVGHYPKVMRVNISASKLGLSASLSEPAVSVEVYSATTPMTSPFRTLLAPSVVHVDKAATPFPQDTVNMTLARDPPERVPSPYAASTSGRINSRVLCEGDYRFSTATNSCQPLTDKDCAKKYRGRRSKFDPVTKACAYSVPPLNGPLVFKPLTEPKPPRTYSPEELRAILQTVKLPKFLRTMEKSYEVYERQMERWENRPVTSSPVQASPAAATGATPVASAAESAMTYIKSPMPGARGLSITCIAATCVLWTVALMRDVLEKVFGIGPWHDQRRCALAEGAVKCWHWLGGACANVHKDPRPPQRSAESNTTATSTTAQHPAPRSTIQSGEHANPTHQKRKGKSATFTTETPMQSTRTVLHTAPREPVTPAPFQPNDPIATPQHERQDSGRKRRLPRSQKSRDAQQKHRQGVPAGATRPPSSWGDARPYVSAAHPPAYDVFGCPSAQHAPFGSGAEFTSPKDMPFMGGDYTSQRVWLSDEGVGFGYVPAAFTRPHSASSQRCYSCPPSPYPASSPRRRGGTLSRMSTAQYRLPATPRTIPLFLSFVSIRRQRRTPASPAPRRRRRLRGSMRSLRSPRCGSPPVWRCSRRTRMAHTMTTAREQHPLKRAAHAT